MPGSDPLRWDAPAIAAAVRAKRVDPVEVIDAFLAQIRRANPAVNALVDHDEAAPRAEAADVRAAVNARRYSALEWASGRGDRCRTVAWHNGGHAFSLHIAGCIACFLYQLGAAAVPNDCQGRKL